MTRSWEVRLEVGVMSDSEHWELGSLPMEGGSMVQRFVNGRSVWYRCVILLFLLTVCDPAVAQSGPAPPGRSGIPVVVHEARSIEWRSERRQLVAVGDVDAEYGAYRIEADTLVYSDTTGRVVARGRVHARTPYSESIRGSYFSFVTRSNEVTIEQADVDMRPWYLKAGRVEGDADTELVVTDGRFTTCNLETPHYDVSAQTIYIYPGEELIAYHAVPRVMRTPVFYWPYLSISLREGPTRWEFEPGYSDRNGAKLGVTYHYLLERDKQPVTGSIYTGFNQETRPGLGLDVEYDTGPGKLYLFYFQSNRRPLLSDTDGRKFRAEDRERMYRFRSQVNMAIPDSRWRVRGNVDWMSEQRLANIEFSQFSLGQPSLRTMDGAVTRKGERSYLSIEARREDRVVSDGVGERFVHQESEVPRVRYTRYASPIDSINDRLYYSLSADATRRRENDTEPYRWESQVRGSLTQGVSLFPGLGQTWEVGYRHSLEEQSGEDSDFESFGSGLFSLKNTIRPVPSVSMDLTYELEKRLSNHDSVPLRLNNRRLGVEEDGFRSHTLRMNSSWQTDRFFAYLRTGYDLRNRRDGEIESDSRVISPLLNLSTQLTPTLGWDQFFRYDWSTERFDQLNTSFTYEPTRNVLTSLGWNFNRGTDRNYSDVRNRFLWRVPDYGLKIRSDFVFDTEKENLDETRVMISKQLHMWKFQLFYRDVRNNDQEISFNINLMDYSTAGSGYEDNIGSDPPNFDEGDWRSR